MNEKFDTILSLIPRAADSMIAWDGILHSELGPSVSPMAETPQNPEWHGEGDVWAHTKMVCESLIRLASWQGLERRKQEMVFLAALLHDIGKVSRTRVKEGQFVSPHHTEVGDNVARAILWKDFGLGGTVATQRFRETVCALIRCHSVPFRFFTEGAPEYRAIKTASYGDCGSSFSNELLSILVEADIRGRIANDTNERLEHLSFFQEISKEAGCFTQPMAFPSPFSRFAYLSGRNIAPGQELYNDAWGRVILLVGLPGTGKDTYIRKTYSGLPMVSLDCIRREMNIDPREPQAKVIAAAQEQARQYLRKKQPFVWNATNFSPRVRRKQVDLFARYGAMVEIDYLETTWEETLRRNQNRKDAVPEAVLGEMLENLVPPNVWEAHDVNWVMT